MDTEWTLSYSGTSLTMGPSTSDAFMLKTPEVGGATITDEDTPRPRSDGVAFGADYHGGRTISFDLGIGVDRDQTTALAKAAEVATAWRGDAIRFTPSAMAQLVIATEGRTRLVYGRPRRIAFVNDYQHQGYISAVADFACVDDVFYGSPEQTFSGAGTVTVSSDLKVWPIITITSPSSPVVTLAGRTLSLPGVTGGTVVIDTRPWVRSIMQGGTSRAGSLSVASRLSKAYLNPGSNSVSITGGSMSLAWRSAHPSL